MSRPEPDIRLPSSSQLPAPRRNRKIKGRISSLKVPRATDPASSLNRRASTSGTAGASQRTSKTSQKLVVLPSAPQTKPIPGEEDDDLLGEVAVVGVVERVLDPVAHEHLDAARAIPGCAQVGCSDEGEALVLVGHVGREEVGALLPVRLGGRGRFATEGGVEPVLVLIPAIVVMCG